VKYKEVLQEFQKEKTLRVKLQKELEIRNSKISDLIN